MEATFFAQGFGRNGRRIAPAQKPFRATARGGGMRDCALETGALVLGTAQDSRIIFAPAWRSGQREHVQAGVGASGIDAETAASSRQRSSRTLEQGSASQCVQ